MNWKPIAKLATEAAAKLGHKAGGFSGTRQTPSVKTAMCETCCGCCWIAHAQTRGFVAGGRILKYRCGTKEAAGVL